MYKIRYKKKKVNEDDAQQPQDTAQEVNPQQDEANKKEAENINAQIAELVNKKLQRKTQYQNDIKNIDNQIVAMQKKVADLGEEIDPNIIETESVHTPLYRFGRNLFESVTNRTDEMFAIISLAFDDIESLSYRPSDTRCRTFAKNIIAFLNRNIWKTDDHGEEFNDFMRNLLNASHVSLSTREKEAFIEKLSDSMKDNAMFNWIYMK